jgi:LmbE family N-acetylglucosaminyl deacetylase
VTEQLHGRAVVVSPHLDDGVFSLGSTIAHATRAGAHVKILTVFGCDPESQDPANGWDTRGGFATEGQAAAARRQEDAAACGLVGAEPEWLSFRGGGYTPHKDAASIFDAIAERVVDADAVLVPGFPLRNDDHAWLAQLLADRQPHGVRIGHYLEQPYAYTIRREQRPAGPTWTKSRVMLADRLRKRRALLAYGSQLALLSIGRRRLNMLLLADEAISWSPP